MTDRSQDPFTGAWKLVFWRSQPALAAPQSWIHHTEASAETIRVREEMLTAANVKTIITVHARFDGRDYPVSGSPQTDAIVYSRPQPASDFGNRQKRRPECLERSCHPF